MGDGSPYAQVSGWNEHFAHLDCAYQRCWQETQGQGVPWTVLGRIPNTAQHRAHARTQGQNRQAP